MFNKFESKYKIDNMCNELKVTSFDFAIKNEDLNELLHRFSGCSFNNGIYRVHSFEQIEKWTEIISLAFPDFANEVICFGYDWLGRQFAIDNRRKSLDKSSILMFEPGTGEVLEIPVDLIKFHNEELFKYANEVLAYDFFQQWLSISNSYLTLEQCVGYKQPLFLNGSDTSDNLEIIDLEVYWEISSQLLAKIRSL